MQSVNLDYFAKFGVVPALYKLSYEDKSNLPKT